MVRSHYQNFVGKYVYCKQGSDVLSTHRSHFQTKQLSVRLYIHIANLSAQFYLPFHIFVMWEISDSGVNRSQSWTDRHVQKNNNKDGHGQVSNDTFICKVMCHGSQQICG